VPPSPVVGEVLDQAPGGVRGPVLLGGLAHAVGGSVKALAFLLPQHLEHERFVGRDRGDRRCSSRRAATAQPAAAGTRQITGDPVPQERQQDGHLQVSELTWRTPSRCPASRHKAATPRECPCVNGVFTSAMSPNTAATSTRRDSVTDATGLGLAVEHQVARVGRVHPAQ
jgi:hypothetical protein